MPFRVRTANIFFPATPTRQLRGWRRILDGGLRRLGPTWRAAPVRRGAQAMSLGLFLYLFFYIAWPYATLTTGGKIGGSNRVPLEGFLWIDPLVGISTAIAARHWNLAVLGAAGIFLVCLAIPRGFCGYLCPLGTLIDGFDWVMGRPVARLARKFKDCARRALTLPSPGVPGDGSETAMKSFKSTARTAADRSARRPWWVNIRYYLLAIVLTSSALGVLLSGVVAAIPVLTRGLLLTGGRVQLGWMKNWGQVTALDAGAWVSLGLFGTTFLLGLVRPRFWCKYVCPSGALFSLANLLRLGERKVETNCVGCGKCTAACPFDAIKTDFTTRGTDCTFCQTCGGVCPTGSIKFVGRWNYSDLKEMGEEEATDLSRRAVVLSAVGGAAAAMGIRFSPMAPQSARLLRPPGSVAEAEFLELCIRCGECIKVCPGPVLVPAGFATGLDALWTPVAVPTHAGCHQDCNYCTQVCPTEAIRPLSVEQKRRTPMGLAIIDPRACLPHGGLRDCQLCYDECEAAGYHAIELRPIRLDMGDVPEGAVSPEELEEMGKINAPFIRPDACMGCGLCEYRCHSALVVQQRLLARSAVVVRAVGRG